MLDASPASTASPETVAGIQSIGSLDWLPSSAASAHTFADSAEPVLYTRKSSRRGSLRRSPIYATSGSEFGSGSEYQVFLANVNRSTELQLADVSTPKWFVLYSNLLLARLIKNVSTSLLFKPATKNKSDVIAKEVENLFALATFIDLEPGMDNEFSLGLEDAIARGGKPALEAIEGVVLNEGVPSSIAMEALQYIGDIESDEYRNERRETLERCLLKSSSAWVRDGAGLGIASLDDPRSIPALEAAIAQEASDALKADLELVLDQLRATRTDS